jgi:hypothetical protein
VRSSTAILMRRLVVGIAATSNHECNTGVSPRQPAASRPRWTLHGPAWQTEAAARKRPVPALRAEARALAAARAKLPPAGNDLGRARRRFPAVQLASVAARADLLAGARMRFDDGPTQATEGTSNAPGPRGRRRAEL